MYDHKRSFIFLGQESKIRREDPGDLLGPVIENSLQTAFNPDPMNQVAQDTKRKLVGDQVDHFGFAPDRVESVLVLPDLVWSQPLFIREEEGLTDVCDFG